MIQNRRGFVLIAVLWLLVALGAVGLDAALRSRSRNLAAANFVDEARARAAAQAGVERARSRLTGAVLDRAEEIRAESRGRAGQSSGSDARDPWRNPAELLIPDDTLGSARYTVQVQDAGALLNLNNLTQEALRLFLGQGLDLDYALADRLTQAILDWRDEDDLPRVNGAERDEYLREKAAVLPANREYADLEELRYVMGMTDAIFEAALPYLTVMGSGRININAAPEVVLITLPGITPAIAQDLVRRRQAGFYPQSAAELIAVFPALAPLFGQNTQIANQISFQTNEVEVLVEGGIDGSPIVAREHVIVTRVTAGAVVTARRAE